MPELRKHYFLDEYCIIATEHQQRPILSAPEEKRGAKCQFCPGNEELTLPRLPYISELRRKFGSSKTARKG